MRAGFDMFSRSGRPVLDELVGVICDIRELVFLSGWVSLSPGLQSRDMDRVVVREALLRGMSGAAGAAAHSAIPADRFIAVMRKVLKWLVDYRACVVSVGEYVATCWIGHAVYEEYGVIELMQRLSRVVHSDLTSSVHMSNSDKEWYESFSNTSKLVKARPCLPSSCYSKIERSERCSYSRISPPPFTMGSFRRYFIWANRFLTKKTQACEIKSVLHAYIDNGYWIGSGCRLLNNLLLELYGEGVLSSCEVEVPFGTCSVLCGGPDAASSKAVDRRKLVCVRHVDRETIMQLFPWVSVDKKSYVCFSTDGLVMQPIYRGRFRFDNDFTYELLPLSGLTVERHRTIGVVMPHSESEKGSMPVEMDFSTLREVVDLCRVEGVSKEVLATMDFHNQHWFGDQPSPDRCSIRFGVSEILNVIQRQYNKMCKAVMRGWPGRTVVTKGLVRRQPTASTLRAFAHSRLVDVVHDGCAIELYSAANQSRTVLRLDVDTGGKGLVFSVVEKGGDRVRRPVYGMADLVNTIPYNRVEDLLPVLQGIGLIANMIRSYGYALSTCTEVVPSAWCMHNDDMGRIVYEPVMNSEDFGFQSILQSDDGDDIEEG